jgi:predicted TIM-barrel fold metal-dependent hydrolase
VLTVDVHQHLWPPVFVDALRSRRAAPLVRGPELVTPEGAFPFDAQSHDPEARIALLDRDGIDVAVLSLQSTLGIEGLPGAERDELELAWLEGVQALVAQSHGRFRALAPWRVVDGVVGTSVGASALLDERVGREVLSAADAAGGMVFVHPEAEGPAAQDVAEWWGWIAGYSLQMQRACLAWLADGRRRYPALTIVFAMLAGGALFQGERLAHRGVDLAASVDPGTLFDTATYGRRALDLSIATVGAEHLVYGSDTPVVDSTPTLDAIRELGQAGALALRCGPIARFLG